MNEHKKFYENNQKYTEFLEAQDNKLFEKLTYFINNLTNTNSKILDCGCGTGVVLNQIKDRKNKTGIEISETSISKCKEKNLNCYLFDGNIFPFTDESFDITYSSNVLEHVEKPINFLNEMYRVTKVGGYIILSCPNFLSITNNYHKNTRGIIQKIKNIISICSKYISKQINFNKMNVTLNDTFSPDDDAITETNPIDIKKWSKANNLQIIYYSSQYYFNENRVVKFLDKTFFKIFFGSNFFVFKKFK